MGGPGLICLNQSGRRPGAPIPAAHDSNLLGKVDVFVVVPMVTLFPLALSFISSVQFFASKCLIVPLFTVGHLQTSFPDSGRSLGYFCHLQPGHCFSFINTVMQDIYYICQRRRCSINLCPHTSFRCVCVCVSERRGGGEGSLCLGMRLVRRRGGGGGERR